MNPALEASPLYHDVLHLADAWKNLTIAENQSILADDWVALEALQSRKLLLQELIDKAQTALFQTCPTATELTSTKERIRSIGVELLELEQKNRDILAEKIASTDRELKAMDKTSRSLRGVQRAYGGTDRSFWQAYS